jgi:hypothetical protein
MKIIKRIIKWWNSIFEEVDKEFQKMTPTERAM